MWVFLRKIFYFKKSRMCCWLCFATLKSFYFSSFCAWNPLQIIIILHRIPSLSPVLFNMSISNSKVLSLWNKVVLFIPDLLFLEARLHILDEIFFMNVNYIFYFLKIKRQLQTLITGFSFNYLPSIDSCVRYALKIY